MCVQQREYFTNSRNLIFSFFKLSLVILLLMSLSRFYLFLNYGTSSTYTFIELLEAFFLGIRLDMSILAYIFSIPVILLFIAWLLNLRFLQKYLFLFFRLYFIIFITILFLLTIADLVYFSYFGEHSTLMIFGVIDDDTEALFNTALESYNIPFNLFLGTSFLIFLYYLIIKIITKKDFYILKWGILKQFIFYIFIIMAVAFFARGSLGTYPLARYIPDVSTDALINNLPQSPVHAIINSYKQYKKSKSGKIDIIKSVGYEGKIDEAFMLHIQNKNIDGNNLLNNIKYKTARNEALKEKMPHVVVVMVESFGMPLLRHQSKSFDILGSLKKHFDEDILFTNFISSANGTIVSLEPVLLNTTALPSATAFAQSMYLNTSFKQASAKVYKDAGYETSFVYGGDLSWRNIGSFISRQGFDNMDGRGAIASLLESDIESLSHDWGIFDEHVYDYVYKRLSRATTPQFIFILTTNNHPPHIIPNSYKSNKLEISKELKEEITGDLELSKKRFKDYAYALDVVGNFLDKIKASSLAKNSVVAITADNNTIEGIMHYKDYYTQTKRIPFYIYLPQYLKPKTPINTTLASSHKDIFPTLYNLTLSDVNYTAIGTSLLDENHIHCGFNNAGVIIAKDGGFKFKEAVSSEQKKCQEYYKATLAVTDYLIKSHKTD